MVKHLRGVTDASEIDPLGLLVVGLGSGDFECRLEIGFYGEQYSVGFAAGKAEQHWSAAADPDRDVMPAAGKLSILQPVGITAPGNALT